jgi:hypothetical protein
VSSPARVPGDSGPDLQFLANDADEVEGLSDAGIETFRDNPYASIARECGQNSNDAAVTRPVVVSYDLITIPSAELPGLQKLGRAIDSCLRMAVDRGDEKTKDFFRQAKKVCSQTNFKCLRVADRNTTGLTGPCKPGTPFHSLLKAAGVSTKDKETSSGSFGIGKNAAFAVSDLQTVFYSTIYTEPSSGKSEFLAQGKVKLISHLDDSGRPRRATGYWGIPGGFLPVRNPRLVPEWLRRSEVGTSVFTVGFREVLHWEYRMTYSLVANFFIAVKRESMRFEINNASIRVDASNIQKFLDDFHVEQAAVEDDQLEELQFARDLYACLTSDGTTETIVEIKNLGRISVRVLIREGLPKRVAFIRNGMMITDNLKHFGDKFSRFAMYRDFVALVEPLDDVGSKLFKDLENPRHDELSAERIPDPVKKAAAKRAMTQLAGEIRNIIKSQTLAAPQDEIALDEMSEFFSDGGRGDVPPPADAEDDLSTITYKPMKIKKLPPARPHGPGADGGAGEDGDKGGETGGGPLPGKGEGAGGSGSHGKVQQMNFEAVRYTRTQKNNSRERTIFFTPTASGIAKVTLEASGLNEKEKLRVVKTELGRLVNGELLLPLNEGERTSIRVELSENYDGPIEMSGIRIADLPGKTA